MKTLKNKRNITLLTLVLALGVAVYLNWQYAKAASDMLSSDALAVDTSLTQPAEMSSEQDLVLEALPNKNYGDAQLVAVGESSEFFDEARLNRDKARDEALDKLQTSLKDANLTQEEKTALTSEVAATVESITTESDIESLVKAKGFADCVVFIDSGKVHVTVKTGGGALDSNDVAKIRDIILSKYETQAQNITVVEVQ